MNDLEFLEMGVLITLEQCLRKVWETVPVLRWRVYMGGKSRHGLSVIVGF